VDELGDDDLARLLERCSVFARVSPEQKVRVVRVLQQHGRVVAVTGDGANDAPAIRMADVGVALGRRGTNAAKEAADLIVVDDALETIIDAITEGRATWAAVRDAIAVLVGGNLGEIAFTLGSGLLTGSSPLNARQLLLVNLLTDLVPSTALAVRPPRSRSPEALLREGPDRSLGAALVQDVVVRGVLTGAAAGAGWGLARMTGTRGRASTVALVSLVGAQLGQTAVLGYGSPLVLASAAGSGLILAAIVQTPGVSHFFGCRPLGPVGWSIAIVASSGATAASVVAPAVIRRLPAQLFQWPGPLAGAPAVREQAVSLAEAAGVPHRPAREPSTDRPGPLVRQRPPVEHQPTAPSRNRTSSRGSH
jgi:cation-transporting ATPase I